MKHRTLEFFIACQNMKLLMFHEEHVILNAKRVLLIPSPKSNIV